MATKVTRVVEPFDYVLDADKNLSPDEQTIFTFRPMAQKERAAVLDASNTVTFDKEGNRQLSERNFTQGREIVLAHLIRVQNFPVGEPKEWPKDRKAQEQYLDDLSEVDLMFLGNAVIQHSVLQPLEKNS